MRKRFKKRAGKPHRQARSNGKACLCGKRGYESEAAVRIARRNAKDRVRVYCCQFHKWHLTSREARPANYGSSRGRLPDHATGSELRSNLDRFERLLGGEE